MTLGKRVIVATSTPPVPGDAPEGIEFCDDVVHVVTAARDRGDHCYLFGGGVLVHSFLAANAVDMLTVGVVPVLPEVGGPSSPANTRPSTSASPTTPSATGKSGWRTSAADQPLACHSARSRMTGVRCDFLSAASSGRRAEPGRRYEREAMEGESTDLPVLAALMKNTARKVTAKTPASENRPSPTRKMPRGSASAALSAPMVAMGRRMRPPRTQTATTDPRGAPRSGPDGWPD